MNELAVKLHCIVIRNGIEIWVDDGFAERLKVALQKLSGHTFIPFEGRILNTADITGVFQATDMESLAKKKGGMWLCRYAKWHEKDERECECELIILSKERERKYKECGRCDKGFILVGSTMVYCKCQK